MWLHKRAILYGKTGPQAPGEHNKVESKKLHKLGRFSKLRAAGAAGKAFSLPLCYPCCLSFFVCLLRGVCSVSPLRHNVPPAHPYSRRSMYSAAPNAMLWTVLKSFDV